MCQWQFGLVYEAFCQELVVFGEYLAADTVLFAVAAK
jgi:hypothetical protein